MIDFRFICQVTILLAIILYSGCKSDESKTAPVDTQGNLFTLLSPKETGIQFANNIRQNVDEHIFNFNYIFNGGGVAIADFNKDGLEDLYFTGNQVADRLYLNKGDLKFEDISTSSGITKSGGWRSGVAIVDINQDGYPDIYVCRGGYAFDSIRNKNLLFVNQKNLSFTEEAEKYGIADVGFSITANFFDYDNDNDLDLYVVNRPDHWGISIMQIVDRKKSKYDDQSKYVTDQFYRNNGDGTFTNITKTVGILPNYGFGLSSSVGDFNHDGWDDIYVANDFLENDYLFINDRKGGFKESAKDYFKHIPFYSMGSDMADINNDMQDDLFVVEMRPEDYKRSKTSMPQMNIPMFDSLEHQGFLRQYIHNALYYNYGNGKYAEISQLAGVDKTDWSWSPLIEDFDMDGYKDIFVTNGYRMDVYDQDGNAKIKEMAGKNGAGMMLKSPDEFYQFLPSVKAVNYIYKNNGDLTFSKKMKEWGIQEASFSNGSATADLDNDGDLDIVINNIDEEAFLYRNNSNQRSNYLQMELTGPQGNLDAIGARIQVYTPEGKQSITQRLQRGYLSSSHRIIQFGLGSATKVDSCIIVWPDTRVSKITNVKIRSKIKVNHSGAEPSSLSKGNPSAWLMDVSSEVLKVPFKHKETLFNDYRKQILLPHRMSRMGPFISVGDFNGDHKNDFFIGGARGQSGQVYLQQGEGLFEPKTQSTFQRDARFEDMQSLIQDFNSDGYQDLYIVSGDTESPEGEMYQDRLYLNDGAANFTKSINSIPKIVSSGEYALSLDFDNDGDMDIFRGGRTVPDKYPYAPQSYLLENNGKGLFKDVTDEKANVLKKCGMITSGEWVDLIGDKSKELVLCGDWLGIKIYSWDGQKFIEVDVSHLGLDRQEGWWNKLIATDIDKDGDIDLVCGNLGENYKFHTSAEKPFQVFCNDFDQNGTFDIILTKYNGNDIVPIRGKQCSQEQIPSIKSKFPTFKSFANASLNDLYGESLKSSLNYKVNNFSSGVFWNEGGKFKWSAFPVEAQFSSIRAIVCDDINRDGKIDIIFGGNNYDTEVETTSSDASIGGVILQQEDRGFIYIKPNDSGLSIDAVITDITKLNSNLGSIYLIATNNDYTKVYRNIRTGKQNLN